MQCRQHGELRIRWGWSASVEGQGGRGAQKFPLALESTVLEILRGESD